MKNSKTKQLKYRNKQFGSAYHFPINLHKLLTNPQKYSNIIYWKYSIDKEFFIIIKDQIKLSNELCARSNNTDFAACSRQFCNYNFRKETHHKDKQYWKNILSINISDDIIYSNPEVKNINDILTLERVKCKRPGLKTATLKHQQGVHDLLHFSNESNNNMISEKMAFRKKIITDLRKKDLVNTENSIKIKKMIQMFIWYVLDDNEIQSMINENILYLDQSDNILNDAKQFILQYESNQENYGTIPNVKKYPILINAWNKLMFKEYSIFSQKLSQYASDLSEDDHKNLTYFHMLEYLLSLRPHQTDLALKISNLKENDNKIINFALVPGFYKNTFMGKQMLWINNYEKQNNVFIQSFDYRNNIITQRLVAIIKNNI